MNEKNNRAIVKFFVHLPNIFIVEIVCFISKKKEYADTRLEENGFKRVMKRCLGMVRCTDL
jgi:hypothetical protein